MSERRAGQDDPRLADEWSHCQGRGCQGEAVSADRRVIACNYIAGISPVSKGSVAYVLGTNPGWSGERLFLLARSRSHRWIEKWEDIRRLDNFRAKTIPPEHPLYRRLHSFAYEAQPPWLERDLAMLRKTKERMGVRGSER